MTQSLDDIRAELAQLNARLERLESAADDARTPSSSARPEQSHFWALDGVRSRLPEHPATEKGAVLITGSLTLPGGGPVEWQQTSGTEGMFENDWTEFATSFNALGHPVRLELLRHILSGTHATAELAEIASLGTTGQLHHHLRQLLAAGWVRQSRRGLYEVPAARVVPLLACLLGAER